MVLLAVLAFVPGITYMLVLSRIDRRHRKPRKHLWGVFFLGMFSVILAMLLEGAAAILMSPWASNMDELTMGSVAVVYALLFIGPIEEASKFLAVRSTYESPHFHDPLDGVVYATAAAMGFASLENMLYVLEFGWETLWLRAALSIPAHMVFSAWWGYQMGRKKFGLGGSPARGLLLAALAHGVFDALLMAGPAWLAALAIPFLLGSLWVFRGQTRQLWYLARAFDAGVPPGVRVQSCEAGHRFAFEHSGCPRCASRQLDLVCSRCGTATTWRTERCRHCRIVFADRASPCPSCQAVVPPHLDHCPACGSHHPT